VISKDFRAQGVSIMPFPTLFSFDFIDIHMYFVIYSLKMWQKFKKLELFFSIAKWITFANLTSKLSSAISD